MLKEWACIKVAKHKDVPKAIEDCEKDGWKLHTYNCIQVSIGADANHYLLFEREN